MIINYSIRNFKSVKDIVSLSFEPESHDDLDPYYIIDAGNGVRLLKIGLIYGANGSGKTTVLTSLDFLRNMILEPFEKKTEKFEFKPFLFDPFTPHEDTFFSLEFVHEGLKYLYEIQLNTERVSEERLYFYSPNKALVYERSTDPKKQLTQIKFGNKIKINKAHKSTLEANTLWNNTVLGGFLKTNIEAIELQNVNNWFKFVLKPIITPETNLLGYISNKIENNEINKGSIVKLLKKADFKISDILIRDSPINNRLDQLMEKLGDPYLVQSKLDHKRITELNVNKFSKELWFQHVVNENDGNVHYELNYNDESQGTQRYYQLSGLLDLMIRNNTVICIDELESSLHPDLLRHFLLVFLANAKSAQLIATTHHRELLMERDILRHDALWFTEKKENGSMDLFSLADFDSSVIRKDTSSIYNAYKTGKLGANPILKDYYIDLDDEQSE